MLDATRCLSYWTQVPEPIPEPIPRRRSARRSTAATSARTSARGTAASSGAAPAIAPDGRRARRPRRLARGRRRGARRRRSSGSTCRATTRAGCGGTRSSRSATRAATRARARVLDALRRRRRRAARRARALGARAAASSGASWTGARAVDLARPRSSRSRSRARRSALSTGYPRRAASVGWVATAASRASARRLLRSSPRRDLGDAPRARSEPVAQVFDTAIVTAYVLRLQLRARDARSAAAPLHRCRRGCVRFGDPRRARARASRSAPVVGRLRAAARATTSSSALPLATRRRSRPALELLIGADRRLARAAARDASARTRGARADEAEALRDELGRRADLLDAANRCARRSARRSSCDEAFAAFIRELRGLLPSTASRSSSPRTGSRSVMADRRRRRRRRLPAGLAPAARRARCSRTCCAATSRSTAEDLDADAIPEEARVHRSSASAAGVAAPLLAGRAPIGMLSRRPRRADALRRRRRSSSSTLLGRLVATAAQNIRAYEAERRRSRSCAASRRCAPTSSRSSRTSCAARWRP